MKSTNPNYYTHIHIHTRFDGRDLLNFWGGVFRLFFC